MNAGWIVGAFLVISTASCCGKEAGRVPFGAEGTADAPMTLQAGEVWFWTDLDIEYKGNPVLEYEVQLLQGGTPVAKATCDPLGRMSVKAGWVETNIGDSHTRRGAGKMDYTATIASGGATTVRATLAFSRKPIIVKLVKADLVVKQ